MELEMEEKMWDLYERWQSHHTVSRSIDEQANRFDAFKANAHYVRDFNKKGKPYKLRLNMFADMTNDEFLSSYVGSRIEHHRMLQGGEQGNGAFMYENIQSVPPSVDWRENDAVTGVKSQGQCRLNQIQTKKLVSLSEQELVDCDTEVSLGCQGGYMESAFEYITKYGGIATEKNYPYKATDHGSRDATKVNSPAVSIDGYEKVLVNDEDALLKAAAYQPISVEICLAF